MDTPNSSLAPAGRIHVVHLVMALNVGGLERVVIELARRTDTSRFRTTLLCIRERGTLAEQLEETGIPVISLECGTRGLGTVLYRLVRLLARLRPDVVHTHNPHPHLVGSLAAMTLRVPVLINTKHGRNNPDQKTAVLLNRIASYLSTVVVAVSTDAADVAARIERVPRRKVRTIHNGIDLDQHRFTDRTARRRPISAVHVARLNPIKDQRTLLEAVRIVVERHPGFCLTVVGDGPLREELQQLRDQLNLKGNVAFLGVRNDVPALLAEAELFLLSSLQEGLSLTLLEAMASGLAVIATDVGGNRELVRPGETGRLVPSRSPELMAAAILDLITHPTKMHEMGKCGRKLVEREFSMTRMVREYENLYEASLVKRL